MHKNMDIQQSHNNQLLFDASIDGDLSAVIKLLSEKADINAKDHHASTPLILAARNNHLPVVRFLVERVANVDDYEFPEDQQYNDFNGQTASIYAVINDNLEMLKVLLANGADKNMTDALDQSLLSYAVQKNHPQIVRFLLSQKVDTGILDFNNYSALDYAIEFEHHAPLVEFLDANNTCYDYAMTRAIERKKNGLIDLINNARDKHILDSIVESHSEESRLEF